MSHPASGLSALRACATDRWVDASIVGAGIVLQIVSSVPILRAAVPAYGGELF